MHRHMRICPAHNLRLEYFWESFPIVDEDSGELEITGLQIRPFTEREYRMANFERPILL